MDVLNRMREFSGASKLACIWLEYLRYMKEGDEDDKKFYHIIFSNIIGEPESNWGHIMWLMKKYPSFNGIDFIYGNYICYFRESIFFIISDFDCDDKDHIVQKFIIEIKKIIRILGAMYDSIKEYRKSYLIRDEIGIGIDELERYINDFEKEYIEYVISIKS